ncbi:MAG: D-alanyl-D-alanine carboxypeptidase [bacterium]|nr:D-alanyl-D-alanine carboxypeptidase [bacterium]
MMQRLLSPILVLAAVTTLAAPVRFPVVPEPPVIDAGAWIVVDAESGLTVLEGNADEERAMASVTKLMTALVVRDHADLDTRVRISQAAADVGEAEIGLVAGEVWSIRDLLAAVLVRSGNDAATALAEHAGGSLEGFADMMNAKAIELGLEHSHFINPHGLDDDEHYTSARDLTVVARAVLDDDVLAQLTRTGFIRFKPGPDGADRFSRNTNRLLNKYPGVVGMKTGYTGEAGRVLVSVIETDGQELIGVVMGSEDHFADTAILFDYATARLSLRDRFLMPLVEQEGGGGTVGPTLDLDTQTVVKMRRPLVNGREQTTAWGDTPGTQAIVDMVRGMVPIVLGGSG